MRLAIGSDHARFELKGILADFLKELGHEVVDVGTYSTAPVDYPDFAGAVGNALLDRRASRGVLICGSGIGASVAANKMAGIRAGFCHDYSAHQGVEHDAMNVLVSGASVVGVGLAKEQVEPYSRAVHLRRAPRPAAAKSKRARSAHERE
jgi:RpiB/LacA/LacB family sugar-phosphate isomerase